MYEAYRIFQSSDEFRQRVYPIVLKDAELFSFDGQKKYLQQLNHSCCLPHTCGLPTGSFLRDSRAGLA